MLKKVAALSIVAAALACGAAHAGTTTVNGNITVTASVVPTCTVTAGNIPFGNIQSTSVVSAVVSTTISVNCLSASVPYTVAINNGTSANGAAVSGAQRSMTCATSLTCGTSQLAYEVFTSSSPVNSQSPLVTTVNGGSGGYWTYGSVPTYSLTSNTTAGTPDVISISGRILANSTTPPIGDYSDTLRVDVVY